MRAPRNTTQFIMNQVYEDMRQQEKLERQQAALRVQQAQEGGISPGSSTTNDAPHRGIEEDSQLPEDLYGFMQEPSLTFSPAQVQQNQSPTPRLVEEEEKNDDECEEVCDEKEESEEGEEDRETEEDVGQEETEEVDNGEEEEEDQEVDMLEEAALEEGEQREEDKFLPLGMPLSILVGDEERDNFINYDYLSQEQVIPNVPEADLFMVPDGQ